MKKETNSTKNKLKTNKKAAPLQKKWSKINFITNWMKKEKFNEKQIKKQHPQKMNQNKSLKNCMKKETNSTKNKLKTN